MATSLSRYTLSIILTANTSFLVGLSSLANDLYWHDLDHMAIAFFF